MRCRRTKPPPPKKKGGGGDQTVLRRLRPTLSLHSTPLQLSSGGGGIERATVRLFPSLRVRNSSGSKSISNLKFCSPIYERLFYLFIYFFIYTHFFFMGPFIPTTPAGFCDHYSQSLRRLWSPIPAEPRKHEWSSVVLLRNANMIPQLQNTASFGRFGPDTCFAFREQKKKKKM